MCTTLRIKAGDGTIVVGRTMEFGIDPKSHLMVIPAGTEMVGSLPSGAEGMRSTTRFGMVGATALGLEVIVDGINDQGLYVGDLYFPGFAKYGAVETQDAHRAMASFEFGQWLLGQFASVAEVRGGAHAVCLADTVVPALNDAIPPLHFAVHDKTGASLVIEPIDGKLVFSDNPVGVLTNAPPFDWHLTNIRNYTGLNAVNKRSAMLGDYANDPLEFGNGTGMFGLPGDASPPSRFIRAVAYSQAALPVATARDAVHQVFHIMNSFDIPPGSVRDESGAEMHADTTAWTAVVDLRNLVWAFRTFRNQNLRKITLSDCLRAAAGSVKNLPMESDEVLEDVSSMTL